MRCTAGTGFGREGKIKRKRIGKTRQREDEGGNGGEKMKNEITKKVPKDGAKGHRGRLKSLYLWALSASVTLDCITIAFLYLPVVRSSELIMRVISNAFGSRCEVNYSA